MTRDDPIYTAKEAALGLGISVSSFGRVKKQAGIPEKTGKLPYMYSQNEVLAIKKFMASRKRKGKKIVPRPTYVEHCKKFLKDQGY